MPSKNAPSRKKSKGYYAEVKKGRGTGSKAGGGMTKKVQLNTEEIILVASLKQQLRHHRLN